MVFILHGVVLYRERAEDRHVAALREEMNHHQQRKGEKRRQVERLRLTREREGQRARDEATRLTSTHQPPIIMVYQTHSHNNCCIMLIHILLCLSCSDSELTIQCYTAFNIQLCA